MRNDWIVITDDEWLCFGMFATEEQAARVASVVAREHNVSARPSQIQRWSWRRRDQELRELARSGNDS